MNSNIRNSYNINKIKKFNNIDQQYNQDELKNIILQPMKIEKSIVDFKSLINNKTINNEKDFKESINKRVNEPYKGIIKNFDYSKIRAKHEEDLIVHKVTNLDKDKNLFNDKMKIFKTEIKTQNNDIKNIYSLNKVTEHKKEFDYQHKYKYRTKLDSNNDDDLRIDRIEFYKKEQSKAEENKKKIDDILFNLIDSGILSENLDSIDYNKINTKDLELTLKNAFGEEDFEKLLKEIE